MLVRSLPSFSSLASLVSLASIASLSMLGAACSSSSDATTPTGDTGVIDTAVTDSAADTAVADTGAPDTATSETTADAPVDAALATCTSYCSGIQAACTTAKQQYATVASCLGACAGFVAGTPGATSGNSFACRAYHLGLAVSDPGTHCKHAGPSGGDNDPTDTVAGTCGEACDSFCDVALKACTGANKVWNDKAACLTECKTFKADVADYSTADTTKNDFGCRLYHLTVAATDATAAATHCGHISAASPVCTM
jgi:hypothetical protein